MRRFVALLCLLLALAVVVPTLASPAAQTFDCNSVTGIPVTECQALVALYTSTNGPGWANHTGWAMTTTPCSWYGVQCDEGHVTQLNLYTNQLSGSLPSELGNLTYLRYFRLYDNQLSGALPPQLGNLTSLQRIYLQFNQLSGTIPPELGNLSQLEVLNLSDNRLEGNIPPELGSLTNLRQLWLHDNQLSGEIPATLANLTLLADTFNDLSYNCLTTSDPTLLNFLASKAPNWADTQTIPPTNLQFLGFSAPTSVTLRWTPITYTGDAGYYRLSYATHPNGPYTAVNDHTANKTTTSYTFTGLNLNNGTTYYFTLQSYTLAHGAQQNNLLSAYSQVTSATTSATNAIPVRGYYDTTRTPTLTWNSVSWAAWYEIQVALSPEFLPGDFVYTKVKIPAGTLAMTLDPLDNGVYYWRVRAIRADRMVSAWSAVDNFVVDAAP